MNIATTLTIEKEVSNDYFDASFVRQPDGRLQAHIKYKKWSASAKKETKKLIDTFDEPLYTFIQDMHFLKFLNSLGFYSTGRLVNCPFPGKEKYVFGEAVYTKESPEEYCLKAYEEVGNTMLPLAEIDGYGRIEEIEENMSKLPQAQWETKHHFSDGVYTRETYIPEGTILTGYRHKHKSVSVLALGIISIVIVDPSGRATAMGVSTAPTVFTTEAGIKKVGFAHTDVVFTNSFNIAEIPQEYHNEENIDMIEDFLFEKGSK